jgi:hypothetical protein
LRVNGKEILPQRNRLDEVAFSVFLKPLFEKSLLAVIKFFIEMGAVE